MWSRTLHTGCPTLVHIVEEVVFLVPNSNHFYSPSNKVDIRFWDTLYTCVGFGVVPLLFCVKLARIVHAPRADDAYILWFALG